MVRRDKKAQRSAPAVRRKTVSIELGLQGGGAHGAFPRGVPDRLLDEPWLRVEGISGTSAGATSAARPRCSPASWAAWAAAMSS